MHVVSLNVGMPRRVESAPGETVLTGIFKTPVPDRRAVARHQIAGDGQADLEAHGGADKAVYGYPVEHYARWHAEAGLPLADYGLYGENLTTSGLLEEDVCIGDRYRVGTAVLEVSQPRMPCFKLGLRLGRKDFPKVFLQSRRSGFYFRVITAGDLGAGDAIERVSRDAACISIYEAQELAYGKNVDLARLTEAMAHPGVSAAWKKTLGKRMRG